MGTEWVKRHGYWTAKSPTRPGIYRLQEGGFLIRSRIDDPKAREETGKRSRKAVVRALKDATLDEAVIAQAQLKEERREAPDLRPQSQYFEIFALSRFRAKLLAGDIKSAKGREKWESTLRLWLLPAFGRRRCDEIRAWHVVEFRTTLAQMMADGYESVRRSRDGKELGRRRVDHLSPETANTWLGILRTLLGEMSTILELGRDVGAAVELFDTTSSPTYTDESPNSLAPEQAREFLTILRRRFPQHYAMALVGFVTGKRPSNLRPLRAAGAEADVDWTEGFIRFRRSHTRGDEFMAGTKTGRYERVYLPEAVMAPLREHRAMMADPPVNVRGKPPLWWRKPMAESELLFPARDGGPHTPSVLDKPFAAVAREMGLPFHITPRAMRRTCNDLCRAAEVDSVVTRSITGHLTEDMREHYSTARASEQRQALAKVIDLVAVRKAVGA